jgi:hypothetical protein
MLFRAQPHVGTASHGSGAEGRSCHSFVYADVTLEVRGAPCWEPSRRGAATRAAIANRTERDASMRKGERADLSPGRRRHRSVVPSAWLGKESGSRQGYEGDGRGDDSCIPCEEFHPGRGRQSKACTEDDRFGDHQKPRSVDNQENANDGGYVAQRTWIPAHGERNGGDGECPGHDLFPIQGGQLPCPTQGQRVAREKHENTQRNSGGSVGSTQGLISMFLPPLGGGRRFDP